MDWTTLQTTTIPPRKGLPLPIRPRSAWFNDLVLVLVAPMFLSTGRTDLVVVIGHDGRRVAVEDINRVHAQLYTDKPAILLQGVGSDEFGGLIVGPDLRGGLERVRQQIPGMLREAA